MGKQSREKQSREQTANEFTNVKDIKGNYLYTKDGYVFAYLQIEHMNLDLLSDAERKTKTEVMSRAFDGDRRDFVYQSFPREVDLDNYKDFLKRKYQDELESIGRRRLLAEMLLEAVELSTFGENFEHQHYIKIWKKIGSRPDEALSLLKERLGNFQELYDMAGVRTEVLGYEQIIKLCNLYGNSAQLTYEIVDTNALYTAMPQLGEQ